MGADLYIARLFDENHAKWKKRFDDAVLRRDALKQGTPEYERAQARLGRYFDKLHEQGYFRDPYNYWELLCQFDLSWWQDVIPMLNKHRCLSVGKSRQLLTRLKEQEPTFEQNIAGLSATDQDYFKAQYQRLQQFLNQAIELGQPIECSL